MKFKRVKKGISVIAALAVVVSLFTGVLGPVKKAEAASLGFDENDTIYQIMVDRFHDGDSSNNATGSAIRYGESSEEDFRYMKGGDWQGVIDKLPYIKGMGYTAIWISPVAEPQVTSRDNNGTGRNTAYHGFNVKDPNKANPYFGTKEKLKELVDSAHNLGIRVIIDVVPNHIGDYMLGTNNYYDIPSLQPAAPFNNPAWYHHNGDINWSLVDGNYTQWAQDYIENHDLAGLDDIDHDNAAAKNAIFSSIKGWFDYTGADAMRVDAAKLIKPSVIHELEQYVGVKSFGENFDGNAEFVSRWVGSNAEWGMLDFPLFFSILNSFAYGQSFDTNIKATLAQDSLYNGSENHMVTFIDNHDRNRFLTETGGNVQKLQNALTFIFTVRGVPVVFQGTEQNKGNGNGSIITGGIADTWNRWSMVKRDSNGNVITDYFNTNTDTYQYVAKLNKLRQDYPALRTGKQREMWSAANLYAFSRKIDAGSNAGDEVISVFNNSGSSITQTIPLRAESSLTVGAVLTNLLNTSETVTVQSGGATGKQITITVGENSNKVLAVKKTVADTQAPTVPDNVTAVLNGDTAANISWSASTDNVGVTEYEVYRNGVKIATVPGTSYSDTGLQSATTYSYTVKAKDAAGNLSAFSSAAEVTTPVITPDTQAPTVPDNVTATLAGSNTAQLSWSASTDNIGVTGYEVYRDNVLLTTVTTTSYQDTNLQANTTYSYTVQAKDAAGNVSGHSSSVTVTTPQGNNVTIYYKTSFTTPYIHYKVDGESNWTTAPGVPMTAATHPGYFTITLPVGTATGITAAFNNGGGTWDNNSGNNYHFSTGTSTLVNGSISQGEPQPDSLTFTVNVPTNTTTSDAVYITGDFNSWNPADPAYQLTRQSNGTYSIKLDLAAGTTISYKFTRGSWAAVETNSNGSDINNRTKTTAGGGETFTATVQRWKDR
ncbi:Glycosidase [Fontibacillus panacisegetis]|uniref:Glycosidase n=1 Tax=Fontibacillus panacisegetis TaxID=670482 RepID=A0A1G7JA32_9BACL|nr:alpha-amylase family glycosyl hydrolase [Fontibacillus panacisegetis]SDF21827.1 Glycosidase [Fontibacillus panacisegetis]